MSAKVGEYGHEGEFEIPKVGVLDVPRCPTCRDTGVAGTTLKTPCPDCTPMTTLYGQSRTEREAYFHGYDDAVEQGVSRERRERIATAMMAGFATKPYIHEDPGLEVDGQMAKAAVRWADALIAELDKEKP